MDHTHAIMEHTPPAMWGIVWLELHDYPGTVTRGLIHMVMSRCATNEIRAHYYRLSRKTGTWVRRCSVGISQLDWEADKRVYHLFEVRDELPQYEKHLGPDRWDRIVRKACRA